MSDLQIEEIQQTRTASPSHQHLLSCHRFRPGAEYLTRAAIRQRHGVVSHRRHQPRLGDDRHLRERPRVCEAGSHGDRSLPGPRVSGAPERRAAAAGPAVAHPEDPLRTRQSRQLSSCPTCSSMSNSTWTCRQPSRCRPTPSSTPAAGRPSTSNAANGVFEPRLVETGWRLGDRVQITQRPRTGRTHRRLRQLPDRFRKPHESCSARPKASSKTRLRHGRDPKSPNAKTNTKARPTSADMQKSFEAIPKSTSKSTASEKQRPVCGMMSIQSGTSKGDLLLLLGNVQEELRSESRQSMSRRWRLRTCTGRTDRMISRIIDFSARNRLIVLTLVAVAAIYGWWSMNNVALDAIPDLSDTQVIVYSRWDRSPDIIEDQVTYPIVTAMLGAPKVQAVRGFSDFGYSFVYVIFEDGTDIYWARTRTLEYLSSVLQSLPQGSKTELGPGRHRSRLDLPVRAGGQFGQAQPGGPAVAPGLVSALSPQVRARRRGSCAHRRIRQAVPGERRSEPAAGLQHPDQQGGRRHPRQQQRNRRPHDRAGRRRVHGARPRLCEVGRRHRDRSSSPPAKTARRSA